MNEWQAVSVTVTHVREELSILQHWMAAGLMRRHATALVS